MQITRRDAEALMSVDEFKEIVEGVVKESKALSMFRKLPNMSSNKMKMRVLDSLPLAYWVDAETDNGRKKLTKMAWDKKFITAEELAVIVPIKEDVLDDAEYDIWAEVKPRIVEAFGKKIDEAIFLGIDKPANFRMDLVSSVRNAGANITPVPGATLYSTINDAMAKVEASGYNVTGILGGVDLKAKFRMMLDTTGQPVKDTEIGSLAKAYMDNGAWDKTLSQMILGDMSQAVYAIRQDITYKMLDQAVIQDPATSEIIYNLAQEDMVALRVVMRMGWEIPNPINALEPDASVRFPFASIDPVAAPTTYDVEFTVTDGTDPIEGAKVLFAGVQKLTDASGEVTFTVGAGSYNYSVSAEGATTVADVVTVTNADVPVAVELVAPEDNG